MTVSKAKIREVMAELGARGGKQKSLAQSEARAKNMEKARKAKARKQKPLDSVKANA